jgi:cytochrome c553
MNLSLRSLTALLVASVTVLSAQAQDIKGDAAAGLKKNAMCIGCHGIAVSLSDQDMADLAAFYSASGVDANAKPLEKAADGSAKAVELVAKGACSSCHGESLSKPIDPSYPKIAGQYSDYLFVALKAYKTEGNPQIGRGNAIMGGVAKQFSNAELKVMANYLGGLPGDLKSVPESRFR